MPKDKEDRTSAGFGGPPADPTKWSGAPNTDPQFKAAVDRVYAAVTRLNTACIEYQKTPDVSAYNAATDAYDLEIKAIQQAYSSLDLEWPTLFWNGKFVHTFIVQQTHHHSSSSSTLSYHSSSSLGWP